MILLAVLVVAAIGADLGAIMTNPVDRRVEFSPEDVRTLKLFILGTSLAFFYSICLFSVRAFLPIIFLWFYQD